MTPAAQKALVLEKRFGDLVVNEIPVPTPNPGEVLVKVLAAGLNPIDWKISVYGLFYEKEDDYPAVLGCDIAGEIEALGEGVADFKVGDRIFTQAEFLKTHKFTDAEFLKGHGAFQQYALAYASTLSKIPKNLSVDEAATVGAVVNTAYLGLYKDLPGGLGLTPPTSSKTQGIYNGTPIVILGGASSVGQNVIQLAKLSGLSPIITTASLSNSEYLKSLGATHVFDRNLSTEELKAKITAVTHSPIKHVFDTISLESTQKTGLTILDDGGTIAVVLPPTVEDATGKSVVMVLGWLRKPDNLPLLEPFCHDVIKYFYEKGFLKPNAIEVLPKGLNGITDGLQRLQTDAVSRLKLVARPHEIL